MKGWEITLDTEQRHRLACQTLYTDTSPHVKKVSYRYECLQWTRLTAFELVKSVFSGIVSYDNICILRRFCKLKSCGCTSLQVGQRWNTRCDMLNVTHRHVFVSQQVCRHQSFSVWTRAWPRLVDASFVWKHVGRDKTWEIRWQVTYRHVLLCENLHTDTTL